MRGCGAASDYLDPRVTLSPCVIAYAEIGVWRATPVCLPEPGRLVRRAMHLEADVRMAALTD